jgi:predicted dehydrogenase
MSQEENIRNDQDAGASGAPVEAKTAADEKHGLGRRDLLKALISVPVFGVFLYNVLKKKAGDDLKRQALLSELGLDGAPAYIPQAVSAPPSERIGIGIIGNGGEGSWLLRCAGFTPPEATDSMAEAARKDSGNTGLQDFLNQHDLSIDLLGVCDIFDDHAERGLKSSANPVRPGAGVPKPARRYRTYQELLADRDIDAIIIATPDHWHARQTIAAVEAGKHVYCEKAMTRTEEEALAVWAAVKRTGMKYQLGHQNRQQEEHEKAKEIYKKGLLGPVTLVETTTNRNDPIGAWYYDVPESASPTTIDWAQFIAAAPHKIPFDAKRFFRWRCWFDYGTGLAGDLMSHEFDAANQILDLGIPASAVASGGIYFFKEDRDVPDVFQVALEYPERNLTFLYSATLANSHGRGKMIMGHDASMEVGNGIRVQADSWSTRYREKIDDGLIDTSLPMFTYRPGAKRIDAVTSATEQYFASRGLMYTYRGGVRYPTNHLHIKEWLDCIREGGEPSCNVDRGLEEALACHMATRSYLERRQVRWDPVRRRIV